MQFPSCTWNHGPESFTIRENKSWYVSSFTAVGPITRSAHCPLPLLQGKLGLGRSEANSLPEVDAYCSLPQQGWRCCEWHDNSSVCICGAGWGYFQGINGCIGDLIARNLKNRLPSKSAVCTTDTVVLPSYSYYGRLQWHSNQLGSRTGCLPLLEVALGLVSRSDVCMIVLAIRMKSTSKMT